MKPLNTTKSHFNIGKKIIGDAHPVYFIADIAANHDGDLGRAKDLIYLAKEAGANAAKFQHFAADTIVSDFEFKRSQAVQSHQSDWTKSVYEVYASASVNLQWTSVLKETCDQAGIEFMTSPYSYELADHVDPYLNSFKIGSGDITWIDYICHLAKKNKPLIIATGASTIEDVERAVKAVQEINSEICIMQCNTNYTGNIDNFKYLNLRVLECYRLMFPGCVLGLSDHTPGHSAVLGAVTLGARVIEKHFTDSNDREGPDHNFSLTPKTWRAMVDATLELDYALGNHIKRVEANEKATVIVQRRALCASHDLFPGNIISAEDLIPLRPCPPQSLQPFESQKLIGQTIKLCIKRGQAITLNDLK